MNRLNGRTRKSGGSIRSLCHWLLVGLLCLPLQVLSQPSELIVDELVCRGNAATSCDFILGYVYLGPGDVLDEQEIVNARLRLSSLPAFRLVDIYLERGSLRNHVKVVVEVVEADPYARESLIGTSYRVDSLSQLLSGRLTHQNLFGTGKILDLTTLAQVPLDGRVRSEYSGRLQYVDPHWLGSKRTFFILGLSGGRSELETLENEQFDVSNIGFDLTIGRRLWDFSYFSIYYRYNAHVDIEYEALRVDGTAERGEFSGDNHVFAANYGWNSEDDPYFPTSGSRAVLHATWAEDAELDLDAGFRKTWTTHAGTSWTFRMLETPGTEYRFALQEQLEYALAVARPVAYTNDGNIRRGRWYVEAGYSNRGPDLEGIRQTEIGAKVGLRLDTRSFGFVDLYVFGTWLKSGGSRL